jgi:pyruvate formate lyase activating enzyme
MSRLYSTQSSAIRCENCGKSSPLISRSLSLCLDCLRGGHPGLQTSITEAHRKARQPFHLPAEPPQHEGGVTCQLCLNECRMAPGEQSYCGLRYNKSNQLAGASADKGNVSWYHDPLPTNCVADWVCPGGSGTGYPRFSHRQGPEFGYKNLAVFYQACSFDCLFCQNWHYRQLALRPEWVSAARLAEQVDEHTTCICYFGGDPGPQLPHALRTSRLALEKQKGRILRICWETNGSMHPALLHQAAELALISGGCIKFDLKAYNEPLHLALCGVSNKRTLENFRLLSQYAERRPSPPLLVASTLLVPGYVDRQEVSAIAAFIASLNPDIPYALLSFHPQFLMLDLPPTSRRHALECLEAARGEGLRNVRVGNLHLLGEDY